VGLADFPMKLEGFLKGFEEKAVATMEKKGVQSLMQGVFFLNISNSHLVQLVLTGELSQPPFKEA